MSSQERSTSKWNLYPMKGLIKGQINKKICFPFEDQDLSEKLPLKGNLEAWLENSGEPIKEFEEMLDLDFPRRLADLTVPKQHGIYCLHRSSSVVANYCYPRAVSIGPYHHGKSHLAKMDSHKLRFLEDFLLRNPDKSYKHYWDELKMLESYLRKYYSSEFSLTSEGFIDMMLLDGCFIVELLIKTYNNTSDKILEDCSLLQYIKSDLLMFENQIPFTVLLKLHGPENMGSLPGIYRLLVDFFWDKSNGFPMLRSTKVHNLLHFYYLQFIPPHVDENWKGTGLKENSSVELRIVHRINHLKEHPKQIPSVQMLMKAGIIFRRKNSSNFLDVTFSDGVLEAPPISIDEPFLHFFVNLVMFERHGCSYNRNVMQAYCNLMGSLLKTADDVEFLRDLGIIEGGSISEELLCNLICKLHDPDYVINEKHYFEGLFTDLLEFCKNAEVRAPSWPIVRGPWPLHIVCTVVLLPFEFVINQIKTLFASTEVDAPTKPIVRYTVVIACFLLPVFMIMVYFVALLPFSRCLHILQESGPISLGFALCIALINLLRGSRNIRSTV